LGRCFHALVRAGSRVWVLSLTHGERGQPAGTLAGEFGAVRSAELASAAQTLGLEGAEVLAYPDGGLAAVPLAGAPAGREALRHITTRSRVVVAAATPGYRCPPAVFDLAIRLRWHTGAQVTVAHPWPAPLAPFGRDHRPR
jgi:LmbE family N-acetylglucosaminyl deacetylase